MSEENVIKVYSTPTWPYCTTAKEFLSSAGAEYVELDVSKDREALIEMVEMSGARSVPVITGGGQVIVGFDKEKITAMIESMKNA